MQIKIYSKGILKIPNIKIFLEKALDRVNLNSDVILGWGLRPTANKARAYAKFHKIPYVALEDGFIHSLGQGILGASPCSLVADFIGIYYDANESSLLENLIIQFDCKDSFLIKRAGEDIKKINHFKIAKYNNAFLFSNFSFKHSNYILLVDQTYGDMSLKYGLVKQDTFNKMLEAALREYPNSEIIIKTHPDVLTGKKQGCFRLSNNDPRINILAENLNPYVLFQYVKHVYVATSQLGFEALMAGKPVTCFGVPFYAGWGLTDDRADPSLAVFERRNVKRSLEEVFAAAYISYSLYVHPDSHNSCELEDILNYFSEQYYQFNNNLGNLYCFGFTLWKQAYIRRYLYAPGNKVNFIWTAKKAIKRGFDSSSNIIVWGNRAFAEARELADNYKIKIWRMEDGFIRSVGLGSDLTPPLSLVVDKTGIYYDPTQPSDLESLLETYAFTDELIMRAANIKKMLLENAVSKYNVGKKLVNNLLQNQAGQCIILIPGQVEDDASIQKGCVDIKTNAALIQQVRVNNPSAYLVYKPHPDVISGNRIGKVDRSITDQYCDLVLEDSSITDCLDIADEVHTMTSLVGFEGLLRHKKVVCYGIPFYANWGLTEDRHQVDRRTRRLTLDELVAATLILYPRYMNWETGAFTTPEFAIETLRKQIDALGGKPINKISWLHRQVRKMKHFYKGVFAKP